MSTQSDNQQAAPVAAPTKKKAKKSLRPSKVQMRSIVEGYDLRMGVTLAESCLLDTLRAAQEASRDRKAYREWNAWECLKNDVYGHRNGRPASAFDLKSEPERFAAVAAILVYLDKERAKSKVE